MRYRSFVTFISIWLLSALALLWGGYGILELLKPEFSVTTATVKPVFMSVMGVIPGVVVLLVAETYLDKAVPNQLNLAFKKSLIAGISSLGVVYGSYLYLFEFAYRYSGKGGADFIPGFYAMFMPLVVSFFMTTVFIRWAEKSGRKNDAS